MSANRHDPLDADERALARVLRALPAGEPPSALDARILAMARDAVVTTPSLPDEGRPRPRRAPRFVWGFGVAASCVMAAGLVWRMGGFGAESLDVVGTELRDDVTESAAAAEPTLQPAPPLPEAPDEHISVDIGAAASRPAPTIAPPPPPPAAPAARAQNAATPDAFADPAREQGLSEPSRRESASREQASAVIAAAPAPVAELQADATESFADADAAETLDSVTVTGTRLRQSRADLIVAEDGNAGPQTWIQRIRARIARGDVDGARASLEAFIERHPRKPLPQDLIDFRAQAGE